MTVPRSSDPLAELLRGEWIDPDSGAATGVGIAAIAIEGSLRGREADLVAAAGLGGRLAVLSDVVTHELLGARVEKALASLARIDRIVLPRDPHADKTTVDGARAQCRRGRADRGRSPARSMTKFAAARDGKPYAVFATAPSMNGYTSANAAITVDGHKKTRRRHWRAACSSTSRCWRRRADDPRRSR
jgi:glycerol-1-phosphate dehydrogenase [NAD(P)+]